MAQENLSSKERASLAREEKAKALQGLFTNCFKSPSLKGEVGSLIQAESRPSEVQQSENELSENRPSEIRQSENELSENSPSEIRQSENELSENRLSEIRQPENKLSRNRPSEIRQSENKLSENRLSEIRQPKNELSGNRPSEIQQSENEPSENSPSEIRQSKNKLSENRPSKIRQFIKSPIYGKLISLVQEIGLSSIGLLAILIEEFPTGEGRINFQHFANACSMSKSALKSQIHTLERSGLIELGAMQNTGENAGRNLKITFLFK